MCGVCGLTVECDQAKNNSLDQSLRDAEPVLAWRVEHSIFFVLRIVHSSNFKALLSLTVKSSPVVRRPYRIEAGTETLQVTVTYARVSATGRGFGFWEPPLSIVSSGSLDSLPQVSWCRAEVAPSHSPRPARLFRVLSLCCLSGTVLQDRCSSRTRVPFSRRRQLKRLSPRPDHGRRPEVPRP